MEWVKILSRSEVLEYLKENYECWLSVKFLSKQLGISTRPVQRNLESLRKDKFVKVKLEYCGLRNTRVPLYQYNFQNV